MRFGVLRQYQKLKAPEITVLDVSASGVLFATQGQSPPSSPIEIKLPIGPKAATIVWTSGEFHGAQFFESLNEAELHQITAASRVVWANFRSEDRACRADRGASDRSAETLKTCREDEGAEKQSPLRTSEPMPNVSRWRGVMKRLLTLLGVS